MECARCSQPFTPTRSDNIYCSPYCRARIHYEANREKIKQRARDWAHNNEERRKATWSARYYSRQAELQQRTQNWREKNRDRHRAYTKDWAKRNPATVRKWQLGKYGLTPECYARLLHAQNGGCAICHTTTPSKRRKYFDVDHCHVTGTVRGLLCEICNRTIGLAKDDPARLERAARYLRESHDASRLSQRLPGRSG